MHYDNSTIISEQRLELVVYNHEAGAIRRKKDGSLYRSSVHYQVTSIRTCRFFPPSLLADIIEDPYRFFNAELSAFPFDLWFLAVIQPKEQGYGIDLVSIANVTDADDVTLFLH